MTRSIQYGLVAAKIPIIFGLINLSDEMKLRTGVSVGCLLQVL